MMEETIDIPACDQANDLIAYLYGELDEAGAESFQRHMHGCELCSGELAAFSGIRRSVVAWRNEALGGVSSTATAGYAFADRENQQKPSALAALREFFNLSPLWMKGAVAFATILFCILAGLTMARFRNVPMPPAAANHPGQPDSLYSKEQLNAIVEQRVQDELQKIKNTSGLASTPQNEVDQPSGSIRNPQIAMRRSQVAANSPARRPLSKVEREQLAADLRLVSLTDDSELELLDDRINQ